MYSWAIPKRFTKSSASRLWDSGSDAESAVTATAFAPSARFAAQARYAESVPPENATSTRSIAARPASSLRSFSSSEPRVVTSTNAAIATSLLDRKRPLVVVRRHLGFGNDAGSRDLIVGIQAHQPDALSG